MMFCKNYFSSIKLLCNLTIKKLSTETPQLPRFNHNSVSFKSKLSNYEIKRIHDLNLNPCLTTWYRNPVYITNGYLQYVWDSSGKRYLDMFGGICTVSVGHCNPKLVDTASKQLKKLWHVSSIYINEEVHEYANMLANRFPDPLNNIFFCNSGSEANDIAMLMSRLHTGHYDIIALRNAYHGCSPYTMSVCGVGYYKHSLPLHFGVHHTTNPDPYNGRFGGSHCRDSIVQTTRKCDCKLNQCIACDYYIEDLENLMNSTIPKNMAAFIAESIQGVGGIVQYPKHFLKRAQQLIKQRKGLLIIDEVQSGFGRTGTHFWGYQSHDIIPDIVTMAKGIGNGFPLAAVITTNEIARSLSKASFFNTFGGNPLACSIGAKVLDIIDEENLQQNSRIMGEKIIKELERLRTNFDDVVGDVRGKGLMIGLELTRNKEKREPMAKSDSDSIIEDCKDMGLLIGRGGANGNVIRISPPMCINDADVDYTVSVLKRAFNLHYERKLKNK